MLISKEWLSEFVDLSGKKDDEIARAFTLRVAEVEGVIDAGASLEGVCVGVITELLPHPKADRLRITMVDVGESSPLTIVCGGSNLFVGQKVAIARIGARVRWHGEGDLITLEPVEIRGVKSDGMICGADEIGLSDEYPKKDEKEILDISSIAAPAGTPLAVALGKNSVLFELDNKALSNRPDLWGLRGLAREFGVVCDAPVSLPDPKPIKPGSGKSITVRVESKDCLRYQAVVVSGLHDAQSPDWMQTRLIASGVRPINAIVDVTNYVMLEGGQPLHAFDFDKVGNGANASIVVRDAREGEKIEALDGKMYELNPSIMVIADEQSAIAVAGVIGGENHSVNESTKTVVIESANFKAASVRAASTALRVRTESSSRFEKSLDPHACSWGIARAVELLQQIFPEARVVSSVVDIVSGELPKERVLSLSERDLARVLGGSFELSIAANILLRIGFGVSGSGSEIRVTVPTFRLKDVAGVHDLVEEVVRLYGYEKITSELPVIPMRPLMSDVIVAAQYRAKQAAALSFGFTEVSTYAYIKPQTAELFGFAPSRLLELANPLSVERPYLAPTLAMNICEVIEKNQRVRDEIRVCEVAKVFVSDEFVADISGKRERSIAKQPTHMVFAHGGKSENNYFGLVRDAVIGVAKELGRTISVRVPEKQIGWVAEGASAEFVCDGVVVGYVGVLHPRVQKKMGIEYRTAIAEIDLDAILDQSVLSESYNSSREFQGSVRDVAIVVAESVTVEKITRTIAGAHTLVRGVEVFDIFRGEKIGADKKAVAMHVSYRADDKTLSGSELEAAHSAVCAALVDSCDAIIR